MKRVQLLGVLLLAAALLAACAPQGNSATHTPIPLTLPPRETASVTATAPAPVAKAAWESKWQDMLTAARQEGKVAVYTSGGSPFRVAIMRIAQLQGIDAEVVAGTGQQILEKILAERRGGLYLADLYVGGFTTMLTQAKPAGVLQPVDSALVLPDVTDPEKIKQIWYGGKIPWVDADHYVFHMSLHVRPPAAINSNLVKDGDIKSWKDLLDPKWKGKVLMSDPTVAGAGQQVATALQVIMGADYLRDLAKTEPMLIRDERLMLQWLAVGKYSVLVGVKTEAIPEFVQMGAPIKALVPSEGTYLTAGSGGISFFNREAHPNAVRVLINTLVTKEGQEIFAPAAGHQSVRNDVSTAHLDAFMIRQPNMKYLNSATEDWQLGTEKIKPALKDFFGPLVKG